MGKKGRRHKSGADKAIERERIAAASRGPTADRWPALTGLRGIAALMVVLFHAYLLAGKPAMVPAPVAWLFANGWSGVDIFFTLSAFLLSIPFARAQAGLGDRPSLAAYSRHRLLRILPAYYAQLLILIVLLLFGIGLALPWNEITAASLAANLFFLYGAVPGMTPALPPWWTLPVELGFYLLLPLFAKCLRPGRWPWLLLAIAASLAWRFWLMHAGLARTQEVAWVEHLPGRLHQFLIGMLAAYVLVRMQLRAALPRAGVVDAVAIVACAAFLALPALGYLVSDRAFAGGPVLQPLLITWHLYASVAIAALLLALALGAPLMNRIFSASALRALGVVSYSLYLWHYPVLVALRTGLGGHAVVRTDFWSFLFYGLLFSLLVAGASWWLVERPAQLWGRRDKLGA